MSEVSVQQVAGSVDRARSILAAAERHDGVPPVSDQALLAAQQGSRELLFFTREKGATPNEPGEGAHAFGIIGDGEVDLVVHPDYRGAGIGSASLSALIERAPHSELRAWSHGDNPAADALLARAGFTPVRTLYRMTLDPTLLPAPTTGAPRYRAPEGFSIRPFDADSPEDPARWVRVNAAAFADHPEQGRVTETDFALQREESWFDPDDLLLMEAPEGDELAGSTWIKTLRTEQAGSPYTETELYAVGVDPAYAGRGLGRALLNATLARMATHRPERVTLYVDGENERAVNMYLASGFTIDSRSRQWLRNATIGS